MLFVMVRKLASITFQFSNWLDKNHQLLAIITQLKVPFNHKFCKSNRDRDHNYRDHSFFQHVRT